MQWPCMKSEATETTGERADVNDGRQATQWLWGRRGTFALASCLVCHGGPLALSSSSSLSSSSTLSFFPSLYSPCFSLVEQSSRILYFRSHPPVAQFLPASRLPQIHFTLCPGGHLLSQQFFVVSLLLPL